MPYARPPRRPLGRCEEVCDTAAMAARDCGLESDPVIEVYKRDVDRTLIRENLRRSVEERFERLMVLGRFAEELRRAGRARGGAA